MKTKNFLLLSTSVFAISIFLIVFHSQPPQSLQNIVSQTHQQIKDFQESVSLQENLRDASSRHLVEEEQYSRLLGLAGAERWHNTTLPVIVTYARGDNYEDPVAFVRDANAKLPYTVLLYNIGLKPAALAFVSNYCNSSKCMIVDLDLDVFPSHVSDESIHAFRPLIIQHALSRVGGVIFMTARVRWAGSAGALGGAWARAAAARGGVLAWPRRAAVTSLTHPRMFAYLHAVPDDFIFVQMVDATRLMVAATPAAAAMMRAWVQCALTVDCIMPLGAQAGGCRFDKKPQYRYSGCHERDASALSIILGLRSGFDESQYAAPDAGNWTRVDDLEDPALTPAPSAPPPARPTRVAPTAAHRHAPLV